MYIVKINGYEIRTKEYQAELYQLKKKSNIENNKTVSKKMKMEAINNLIDGYLLLQQAKRRNYKIDDQIVHNQFRQLQNKYDSKNEFKKELEEFSITPDKILQHMRNRVIIKKFIDENFKNQINIETEVLLNYYEKYKENFKTPEEAHLFHCLISKDEPNAKEKVKKIKAKLEGGSDFCEIVKQYSICPSNKNSGDLGYVKRGRFIDELEEVVFSLRPGNYAGPIETEFGYHFVKVVDKKSGSIPKFNEIKDSLKRHLERITSEIELLKFVRKCRQEADIDIKAEHI